MTNFAGFDVSLFGICLYKLQCLLTFTLLHSIQHVKVSHWRIQTFNLGGPHGERGARAYNGGLEAEPPAGSRGRAAGQGVRGGEAPLKLKAF